MTTKDEMLELADRCEKASGPDHLLDRDIAEALNLDWPNRGPFAKGYTASLDAAMTLVPEGWDVRIETYGGNGYASLARNIRELPAVEIERHDSRRQPATPALALCAAALRARASHKDSNPTGAIDTG